MARHGQTAIPKEAREKFGIDFGSVSEVNTTDDAIVYRPIPRLEELAGSLSKVRVRERGEGEPRPCATGWGLIEVLDTRFFIEHLFSTDPVVTEKTRRRLMGRRRRKEGVVPLIVVPEFADQACRFAGGRRGGAKGAGDCGERAPGPPARPRHGNRRGRAPVPVSPRPTSRLHRRDRGRYPRGPGRVGRSPFQQTPRDSRRVAMSSVWYRTFESAFDVKRTTASISSNSRWLASPKRGNESLTQKR